MHRVKSLAQDDLSVDIHVLGFVVVSVLLASSSVHSPVLMVHVRLSVGKTADLAKGNVSGNVDTRNAQGNVDQSVTELSVKKIVVRL